jgi:hypothetical protein
MEKLIQETEGGVGRICSRDSSYDKRFLLDQFNNLRQTGPVPDYAQSHRALVNQNQLDIPERCSLDKFTHGLRP